MTSAGRLHGKVALVAGAGSQLSGIGTGQATAIVLAREGAHVLVVDRDLEAAGRTVERIRAEGWTAQAVAGDIVSRSECATIVAQATSEVGEIDILVNNVGVSVPGTVCEVDEVEWDRAFAVNIKGVVAMSRAVIPGMVRMGGGAIVNVSSISSIRPQGATPYSTTKGAVIALTQAMAVDHGGRGIRVNCIMPGPLFTPMAGAHQMSESARTQRRAASALGIEGTGWDVAFAALYLASDEARYVTGVVLPVDGGAVLRGPERAN